MVSARVSRLSGPRCIRWKFARFASVQLSKPAARRESRVCGRECRQSEANPTVRVYGSIAAREQESVADDADMR